MRVLLSRVLVTLFLALAALLPGHAQQPPQPPPANPQNPPPRQPTFRTGVNFVRVDVIVSDKNGNPVLDLKPEEFSISEDGRQQKI